MLTSSSMVSRPVIPWNIFIVSNATQNLAISCPVSKQHTMYYTLYPRKRWLDQLMQRLWSPSIEKRKQALSGVHDAGAMLQPSAPLWSWWWWCWYYSSRRYVVVIMYSNVFHLSMQLMTAYSCMPSINASLNSLRMTLHQEVLYLQRTSLITEPPCIIFLPFLQWQYW